MLSLYVNVRCCIFIKNNNEAEIDLCIIYNNSQVCILHLKIWLVQISKRGFDEHKNLK